MRCVIAGDCGETSDSDRLSFEEVAMEDGASDGGGHTGGVGGDNRDPEGHPSRSLEEVQVSNHCKNGELRLDSIRRSCIPAS